MSVFRVRVNNKYKYTKQIYSIARLYSTVHAVFQHDMASVHFPGRSTMY